MQDKTLLRSVLRPNEIEADADGDSGLPSLADGQYQPYARASNKPVYAIHFVNAKGEVRSFQYIHQDSSCTFTSVCITLRFAGLEPVEVRIHGRNLWRLYDYILQHRMPWVAEAARDFAPDGQPVIVKVDFEKFEFAE